MRVACRSRSHWRLLKARRHTWLLKATAHNAAQLAHRPLHRAGEQLSQRRLRSRTAALLGSGAGALLLHARRGLAGWLRRGHRQLLRGFQEGVQVSEADLLARAVQEAQQRAEVLLRHVRCLPVRLARDLRSMRALK